MSVVFYDDFDIASRNATAGLDVGEFDYSPTWYGGTFGGSRRWLTGYDGTGNAIACDPMSTVLKRYLGTSGIAWPDNLTEVVRAGMRVRKVAMPAAISGVLEGPTGEFSPILAWNWSPKAIMVEYKGDTPELRLSYTAVGSVGGETVYDPGDITVLDTASYEFPAGWSYIELLVDWPNDTCSVWVGDADGPRVLLMTGDLSAITPPGSTETVGLEISCALTTNADPNTRSGESFAWDEVWMTNGDYPNTAYAAVGMQISARGPFNFKGMLAYYDEDTDTYADYRTDDAASATVLTTNTDNQFNTLHLFFPEDPRNGGQAWTEGRYNDFDIWGVCTQSGVSQICAVSLTRLDGSGAYPVIRHEAAVSPGYRSGGWTKSDDSLPIYRHVNTFPRPDDGTPYMESDGDGCVWFGRLPKLVGLAFAQEYRVDYTDWVLAGYSQNFDSYFVSGYKIHGEGDKDFQSNYVTVNYEMDANSGATLQGRWDYATDGDSGKWTTTQQFIRYDQKYEHGSTRLKVRGWGKTLQFRVHSVPGQGFKINGWTVAISGNNNT